MKLNKVVWKKKKVDRSRYWPMIENDNENKFAKKMDQWLKTHLDLFGRIWDLNIELNEINICIFYKNVDIVKKSQISIENSMKAAWLEKLTKTRHQ